MDDLERKVVLKACKSLAVGHKRAGIAFITIDLVLMILETGVHNDAYAWICI